jgi:1-acyl-sn-glycerol-3-phosphate acyltransferase
VANHAGALPWDAVLLIHALGSHAANPRTLRPLLEDLLFYFPYLGTLMNRLGAVRACTENAERLLSQDASILVFPEGAKGTNKLYRDRYQMQRFGRGGTIRLALKTGAPIIPVAIVGSEETHPMFGKLSLLAQPLGIPYIPITPTFPWLGPLGLVPLPVRWGIHVGAPLTLPEQDGDSPMDRMTLKRINEDLRASIQTMVNEALEKRDGIF